MIPSSASSSSFRKSTTIRKNKKQNKLSIFIDASFAFSQQSISIKLEILQNKTLPD